MTTALTVTPSFAFSECLDPPLVVGSLATPWLSACAVACLFPMPAIVMADLQTGYPTANPTHPNPLHANSSQSLHAVALCRIGAI